MPRPYVAPRPRCRYYDTSRGCFANDKCRYLHGDPAVQKYAPYEENKTCRFYAQGYCKRGNDCWFRHVDAGGSPDVGAGADVGVEMRETEAESAESDPACSICFEDKPALYGLLSGCSHAFCLNVCCSSQRLIASETLRIDSIASQCIRKWREPEGKGVEMTDSRIHKTCPMCRVSTKFIVPSSRFYAQDSPHKADVIAKYKQSMARVPCRYFVHSKPGNRFCPFGRDCFYRHANADGTPYEFPHGVDVMMSIWPRHRRREVLGSLTQDPHLDGPLQAALEVLEGFAETLATENDGTTSSDVRRAVSLDLRKVPYTDPDPACDRDRDAVISDAPLAHGYAYA
ncbi:hypothetical protein K439DRAFT_1002083 [Ramaria rubella]|nr:hypothetical protein K439DRAFT_1002083 [Ramaria rubella]